MRRTRRQARGGALAALYLGFAACGEPAADPGIEAADASARYVDAMVAFSCAQTFACPDRAWSEAPFLGRHADEEDCVESEANVLRTFLDNAQRDKLEAVSDGRVRYDADAAQRCLDEMSERAARVECTGEWIDDTTSCSDWYTGLGARSAGCLTDGDCQGGLECIEFVEGDRCTGRCRGCPTQRCAEDEWCNRRSEEARCEPIAALGEVCLEDEACGDEERFLCNQDVEDPTIGRCVGLGSAALGEPCSDDLICAFGLACDGAACVEPRVATRDEPCALTSPVVGFCAPGLACAPPEVEGDAPACAPPLTELDPCTSLLQCAPGLQCERGDMFDVSSSACRPLRPDGSSCVNPFECASGTCQLFGPQLGVCVANVRCLFNP